VHFLKCLTGDHERAGTVPEAAIPSQIIRVLDDFDFQGRISGLNGRKSSLKPRHAG
jgi:hypothetical protein